MHPDGRDQLLELARQHSEALARFEEHLGCAGRELAGIGEALEATGSSLDLIGAERSRQAEQLRRLVGRLDALAKDLEKRSAIEP